MNALPLGGVGYVVQADLFYGDNAANNGIARTEDYATGTTSGLTFHDIATNGLHLILYFTNYEIKPVTHCCR